MIQFSLNDTLLQEHSKCKTGLGQRTSVVPRKKVAEEESIVLLLLIPLNEWSCDF